ncbi:MAG: TonB-dependent receptor [Luteimonas sp.]
MTHRNRARLSKLSLALVVAFAAAPAFAQSTSAGVGGTVTGADGQPVAGAEVTVTHIDSGTVSRATTDANGRYTARGLRVGGPYTITVNKAGTGTDTEQNIFLNLNQVSTVDVALNSAITNLGEVNVVASALSDTFNASNKGVGTSVSGRQLEIAPQGNRSIDDIARLDPRITVTDQASGAISVSGVNNRYNNISVDGMSQGDPFGLNANGMPYTGSPISVDTIAAYDIKISDFDVTSDAVGANVNAVTKSGTNEFHGSVYYALKDSDWVGKRNGVGYSAFDTDATKGVTIGGPILKDKLFFFASYEKQRISNFGGASGGGDGLTNGNVTQAELDRAISIAQGMGLTPGTNGLSGVNLDNKRYLAKIDWNINENHRASLTYQQTEEFRPSPYDQAANAVALSSRWYNINNMTKNTSLQLFSDCTENFSTEAKISQQRFHQENGNPIDQPTINIWTANGGQIRMGEDRNRHENRINTAKITASVAGTLYAGDHALKFGVDYLKNNVLNLYGRDLHGVYEFGNSSDSNKGISGLNDFAARKYNRYDIRRPINGYTEADTAAAIVFSQISPFIQDTWQVNDQLSVQYGVRVNMPEAEEAPPRNPAFEAAFGYPNDYRLGTRNTVVLPRASFNYTFNTKRYSQLRGGIGSFQSIPPFVWLANPYQNNGVASGSYTSFNSAAYPFSTDPYNQPFPTTVAATRAQMDSIDPDFKMPTVLKVSLGYDAELPWMGLVATAEVQHIKSQHAAFYQALNIGKLDPSTGMYDAPTGVLKDGRDSFWCVLCNNASSNKNCGANPKFDTKSTVLGNTDKGQSTALTLSLNKPLSNGWYGNLSYTITKATEVGSDGSSQAWSSYQFVSRLNPNEEIATTATREIRNSVKASLGWDHAFFGDYKTSVTAYFTGHDGLPYTWTINGDPNGDGIFQDPAYIPTVGDPNVSYGTATAAQIAAFHSFIDSDSYLAAHRGQVAGRNASHLPWINQVDLGIQQQLPGFFKEHKAIVRLDIYNFLNLLNNDWGSTKQIGGFDTRYLGGLSSVRADGGYVYNLGTVAAPSWQNTQTYDYFGGYPSRPVSRWSLLATLRYEF